MHSIIEIQSEHRYMSAIEQVYITQGRPFKTRAIRIYMHNIIVTCCILAQYHDSSPINVICVP